MTEWAQLSANLDDLRGSGRWPSGPATTLEIIGRTKAEAAHEKLIAWLLNPLANHGLGSAVLADLLNRLDDYHRPSSRQLSQAQIKTQVVGPWGRPDIVVTIPGRRLVIELKIDASEGIDQTRRQADGYASAPNVSFAFLTLGGSPPSDPRFKHILLHDFYEILCRALGNSEPPVLPAHIGGRAVAIDYRATLERMLGLNSIDQEAARYWLRHATEIKEAEAEANRLLSHLHEHTKRAFTDLADQLDDDIEVANFHYQVAQRGTLYQEHAVLIAREPWMRETEAAALGVGLGISVEPKADWSSRGAHRPFWGVYAEDDRVRETLCDHLAQIPDLPDGDGGQWGPWARWWYVDLEPPADRDDLLVYYSSNIANQVSQFWQAYSSVMTQAEG